MGKRGKGSAARRQKKFDEENSTPERLAALLRAATDTRLKRRLHKKLKAANKQLKSAKHRDRQARIAKGEHVETKPAKTIENMKPYDCTYVDAAGDQEVDDEDDVDEFADYFKGLTPPKIMVTTAKTIKPSRTMIDFLKEFTLTFPNTYYYQRQEKTFQKVVKFATNHEFTDLLVFTQLNRKPSGVYMCHLPEGPTSYFRLTGLKLAQDMKGGAIYSDHRPEIILNNFDTRLGHRVGRQLAALFPQSPEFEGRRVITFHNQRDYVFFRHHRYVFKDTSEMMPSAQKRKWLKNYISQVHSEENGKSAKKKPSVKCFLKEIGPRFTLKLRTMQLGTFDDSQGLFEFVWRPDSQVDRKTFFI